jgi:hypothetical protein
MISCQNPKKPGYFYILILVKLVSIWLFQPIDGKRLNPAGLKKLTLEKKRNPTPTDKGILQIFKHPTFTFKTLFTKRKKMSLYPGFFPSGFLWFFNQNHWLLDESREAYKPISEDSGKSTE